MKKIILILFLLCNNLFALEKEDNLKVVLTGKIAKFVTWKDSSEEKFVITVIKNPFNNLFYENFKNKRIKNRDVLIKYIDDIKDLSFTNILFIPHVNSKELEKILEKTKEKNILTISSIRGFAQKGGAVQIYFVSQKGRIKINLDVLNREKFKVKSSFVRIAEVVSKGIS